MSDFLWFTISLLSLIYPIGLWIYILTWQIRKNKTGYLLLNIGKISINKFILFMAFLMIIFALYVLLLCASAFLSMIFLFPPRYAMVFWSTLIWVITSWSSTIALFYMSSSEFEIRDNGICYFFWLIKWEKIDAYSWQGIKNSALFFRFNSRVNPIARAINLPCPIPRKHKDAVDQILAQYLPKSVGRSQK